MNNYLLDELVTNYKLNNSTLNKSNTNFLKFVPIFSDLDENALEQISNSGIRKKVTKDSVIFSENEAGTNLGIIIKGKVKISRLSNQGKEVILTILDKFDFFGEMSILDGSTRSANVTAIEETEIFIIPRNEFINLFQSYPEISLALIMELATRLREANLKIKSFSIQDAEGRVGTVILKIADQMGKIKNGAVEIERLPLQQDIANMASTSRETISRSLHNFANKGLIELNGSNIKIPDYEKFRELFRGK